ncbi:NAD(P)H-hydrate dehydratase [Clostridium sp. E02]|uniref:NAD(P)H-hydrate dehydratase n=1 Tax=Clostridium sp. E02 TaxID=2487134 RepID=UPI000F53D9F6|nr:NAD(P)H-hydrate dehydratase [Clostridium sp. E02]
MRYLVTGEQMKEVDRYSIEQIGIPSLVLMERAALAVFEEAKKHVKRTGKIWVLCGSGNNGADGVATARMFALAGYDTLVILAGKRDKGSREYLTQIAIAEKIGLNMVTGASLIPETCDLFIDALFGVGLDREIKGDCRDIMDCINQKALGYTVAVDLPSGIHSGTGQIMGMAFRCDLTVTFGVEKLGTMLYPGREYANQVLIADIGFPSESIERVKSHYFTFDDSDYNRIPKRPAYSNKGDYGKVLIVAGSKNMSGAALLSALAAYRTGAGMVKIFTVEENRQILQTGLPEAIIITYNPNEAEEETEDFTNRLMHQCAWASAIVLGPGLGQEPYVRHLVEVVLMNAYAPLIVDADGLNVIASYQKLTGYYTENIIITPHLGEMARLTGNSIETIQTNLIQTARDYADRYGITCILKDAATIGALKDQRTYINHSGNSGMAKAGAGDVLTGIIAGLLAMGMEESEAAALGVWIHGCAGDMRKEKSGTYSLLARELTEEIYTMLQK